MTRAMKLLLCVSPILLGLSACGGGVAERVLDRYDGRVTLDWDCEGYPPGIVTVSISTKHSDGVELDEFEILCE